MFGGAELMGGDYEPMALVGEIGVEIETIRLMLRARAFYDNGHKLPEDGDPNPKGHDRHLEGAAYYHSPAEWFVGAGFHWSQLSTTDFSKQSGGPEFGGGYDLMQKESSVRLAVDWLMAGNNWQNGFHGPEVTITFPSPREKRHWFFRMTATVDRYYTTVTEPNNVTLTIEQRSERDFAACIESGLGYRF
ncbi:MAG TPA: hypothetical protein VH079_04955 [Terriglobales bacterium]|nr:hypothetical protein [Terriglobales bacterium]